MIDKIETYSSREILSLIFKGAEKNLRYKLTETLLRRWRSGADVESLIEVLRSESSRERLLGAYYLGELSVVSNELISSASLLSDDPLSGCRQAFVAYVSRSGVYDRVVSKCLAKCLLDLDLYVRVSVIKWGIDASDEIFADFAELVEAEVGGLHPRFRNHLSNEFWRESSLKRGIRGLNIIRRFRADEDVGGIRNDLPEEDSFVFDSIEFSMTRRGRLTNSK